jgi:DNA primase
MSVISEVKQRIDIVELVSQYVVLQKAGRNYKGLCPFHSEKNPSFFIFPEQQTWHCFGACGTGGDVFSFLMKKEGIDFGQALHILAEKAGVVLSPEKSDKTEDKEKEKLFQINVVANEYYHYLLLNTKEGEIARKYLARRRVTGKTIEEFHLGFSPGTREAVKKYLINKGYEEKDLIEAGLIIEREGGNNYDRFFNRLMFPIYDIRSRVIGFGARVLDDSLPKYINSSQTAIFDKGGSLYGIDRAVSTIREKNSIIIVEGYMDVLLLHQHGWQNVVASMGTSLTEKQVGIIKKLTRHIFLALDADVAGTEAALRGIDVINRSGDRKVMPVPLWSGLVRYESTLDAEIRVITLPPGKDPDEVVSEDPHLWQNLVEQAFPMLDFVFDTVMSKIDIDKTAGKSSAIQKLLPLIEEIKDPLRQAQYVQKMAYQLKVSEPILLAYIRKFKNRRKPQPKEAAEQSHFSRHLASSAVEEYCLALLFQYPELRQLSQELLPEYFQQTENRELFTRWQHSPDIPHLESELDESLLEHLYYLLHKDFPPPVWQSNKERQLVLQDCILRLQEKLARTLEGEGIDSSQQLKEIFIGRTKRIK